MIVHNSQGHELNATNQQQLMFASDQAYCNEGLAVTVLQLALMMLG
jgi:hypothetical protein